jgi:Ras-related protein Rab-28
MITNYISGAHAILLCYDITNFESFANLEDWYGLVTRTFNYGKRPYLAIVGNKSELLYLIKFTRLGHFQKFRID